MEIQSHPAANPVPTPAAGDAAGAPAVYALAGEVSTCNARALQRDMIDLLARNRAGLVVDLGRVDFLSSSGMTSILAVARSARAAGSKLVLAAPTPVVLDALKVVGFDRLMPIVADQDAARALF